MSNQQSIPLEGRDHVRKRPGMHIGGTDLIALHHFAYEILDSSVEEAMMGRCDHIEIELHPQQTLVIQDNSQGLPIGWYTSLNVSFIELLFTHFRIRKDLLDHYPYTIPNVGVGLHGVGFAAINPLCKSLHVAVKREGHLWEQHYQEGKPLTPLLKTPLPESDLSTGTRITLQPDFTIMQPNEFSYEMLQQRCQELAYLTPGLRLTLRDFRAETVRSGSFFEADGLASYVRTLSASATKRFGMIHGKGMLEVHRGDEIYQVGVAFALQLTDAPEPQLLSYINSVKSPEGGTHVLALQKALCTGLNTHFEAYLSSGLTWTQLQKGLCAVISLWHPNPQFESPTKIKLMNPEVSAGAVQIIQTHLEAALNQLTPPERDEWGSYLKAKQIYTKPD